MFSILSIQTVCYWIIFLSVALMCFSTFYLTAANAFKYLYQELKTHRDKALYYCYAIGILYAVFANLLIYLSVVTCSHDGGWSGIPYSKYGVAFSSYFYKQSFTFITFAFLFVLVALLVQKMDLPKLTKKLWQIIYSYHLSFVLLFLTPIGIQSIVFKLSPLLNIAFEFFIMHQSIPDVNRHLVYRLATDIQNPKLGFNSAIMLSSFMLLHTFGMFLFWLIKFLCNTKDTTRHEH